ncbi:MAG: hypothetical protein FJ313_06205 [Gemmatimonadetes bacterium]|nr:hypothetical protein [Gemmatimonadota bacterium]
MRAFLPWLAADALFLAAVVLQFILLDESAVLVEPPLTAGSEAAVATVMALFLASAAVRLSVFPASFWVSDLVNRADPAWSAMFLGAVNFPVAGSRLLITAALVARLVAADWSLVLALLGAVSVVAGPVLALRKGSLGGYVAGMYTLQAGVLLAGTALFSRAGVDSAYFTLLVAPLALSAALMACGTVSHLRGGMGLDPGPIPRRAARAAFAALVVSGVSMVGLPPTDGFVSRALTALANLERASLDPLYALLAAALMAGAALAAAALARMLSSVFTPGASPLTGRRAHPLEGLAPAAVCAGSVFLGLFPGILVRNLVWDASRQLFRTGFEGPGVVFRGAGAAVERVFSFYNAWSETAAAFLLVALALALLSYFAAAVDWRAGN